MTKTILRHPAGTPGAQGGEFKTHDRAEADISLDPAIAAAATLSQAALLDAAANGQMLSYDPSTDETLVEVTSHRNDSGGEPEGGTHRRHGSLYGCWRREVFLRIHDYSLLAVYSGSNSDYRSPVDGLLSACLG